MIGWLWNYLSKSNKHGDLCAYSCKTGFSDPHVLSLNYGHDVNIRPSAMFKKASCTRHGEHPLKKRKKNADSKLCLQIYSIRLRTVYYNSVINSNEQRFAYLLTGYDNLNCFIKQLRKHLNSFESKKKNCLRYDTSKQWWLKIKKPFKRRF